MSTLSYTIRPATLDDYPALCALWDEVNAVHAAAAPGVYRQPDGPCVSREYVASLIDGADAAILVAEGSAGVLGFAQVTVSDAADIPIHVPRRLGTVGTLSVGAAFRRQGIGTALMRAAEEWARAHGATSLNVGVWEFNTQARALYERLGYATATRRLQRAL